VRLTPTDRGEELCRRRVAAGYHRAAAGELGRGRAHLAAALEAAPPGPLQTDLRWRLGMLMLADGDLDRAVELLEAALAESRGDQACSGRPRSSTGWVRACGWPRPAPSSPGSAAAHRRPAG
jgi:hypothetical protein